MKKSIDISHHVETLFGTRDENLHVLEDGLNITIDLRSDSIELEGAARDVARAEQVFSDYDFLQRSGYTFNNGDLNSMLRVLMADPKATLRSLAEAGRQRSLGRRTVQPKSVNQRRYLEAIEKHVSQVEGMLNAFGRDFFREAHKAEFFRLAAER